jgi:hypothetical protein
VKNLIKTNRCFKEIHLPAQNDIATHPLRRNDKIAEFIKYCKGLGTDSIIYFFLILIIITSANKSFAGDDPFAGPANWGGTGLLEIPTARVMRDGQWRVGFTQVSPYRYYWGAISPVQGMEISGKITEIEDVPALTANYGNYKDKSIDLKWQFLPEGKWWPAIALGIMDPNGTRLYSSQYIVASKQLYPFDFTIGFGNGRFGKQPLPPVDESFKAEIFSDTSSWLTDGKFFGGIQYAVNDWLTLMAEYSSIQYEKQTNDPAQAKYFSTAVPSNFNFGIRFQPWKWLEADLTWQRGDQLGLNVSLSTNFSGPFIPIYDQPYQEKPKLSTVILRERIVLALYESGFSNIGVKVGSNALWIEAANNKYYYNMKAVGVALRAINQIITVNTGQGFEKIHLLITDNSIPVFEFVTTVADMRAFYAEELSAKEFGYLAEMNMDNAESLQVEKSKWRYVDYTFRPDFKTFLNDPSGFLKFRVGVSADALFTPWKGGTLVAGLLGYPINTVSSSNAPSSTPVRTDIVAYQQQDVELGHLLFSQIQKFKNGVYGRIAAGYLEEEYAGIDWEAAQPLFNGRFLAGLSGSIVKKREPESLFGLKRNDWKDQYITGFINLRLNIPEMEINIDLKNGQFLAGDRGTVITISRNFNGVILSAWYSITDTSVFNDSYNVGYHDKGIALSIPLRMLSGWDSRTVYKFAVSPWTRDVAQDIGHFNNLFDFIGRNVKVYTDKDNEMIQ